MKCPDCNLEVQKISDTVYENGGILTFWFCTGRKGIRAKHVLRTEQWGKNVYFYEVAEWHLIKKEALL